MQRFIKFLPSLLLIGVVAFIIALGWFFQVSSSVGSLEKEKLVYIPSGSSIKSIARLLTDEGVINNNFVFIINARLKSHEASLKAGEYLFPAKVSVNEVVTKLQNGKTYYHQLTIPEGLTSVEIVDLLKNAAELNGEILATPVEGSLLPETYSFSRGDTRQNILKRMQNAMTAEIDRLWELRDENSPVKTKAAAIILASIVEKETGIAEERPRVAGVFINRLNKKIPLQTDPTVIYAITEGKKKMERALTYKDLKTPSPYNTYLVQGLPPTPIANPGKDSLKAVMSPEKHKYIYFVANGAGGHVFAKTLQEHNRNVRNWQKIKKNLK